MKTAWCASLSVRAPQNEDGTVWSLGQLAAHMGKGPFGTLWQDMQRSTALVLAAALPRALEVSCAD